MLRVALLDQVTEFEFILLCVCCDCLETLSPFVSGAQTKNIRLFCKMHRARPNCERSRNFVGEQQQLGMALASIIHLAPGTAFALNWGYFRIQLQVDVVRDGFLFAVGESLRHFPMATGQEGDRSITGRASSGDEMPNFKMFCDAIALDNKYEIEIEPNTTNGNESMNKSGCEFLFKAAVC